MSIRKQFKLMIMYGFWLCLMNVSYAKANNYVTINGGVGSTGVNYGEITIIVNNDLVDGRLKDVKTSLEIIIKELRVIGHEEYENNISNIEYFLKKISMKRPTGCILRAILSIELEIMVLMN